MRSGPSRAPTGTPFTERLPFKVVALMVVAAMTILLWLFALPRVVDLVTPAPAGIATHGARVQACPGGASGGLCTVGWTGPDGRDRTARLVDSGLFDVSVGESLTVDVDPAGQAVAAGWRPVVDALLLTALAGCFTVYTLRWWRRVLTHGDPVYDGGDPAEEW